MPFVRDADKSSLYGTRGSKGSLQPPVVMPQPVKIPAPLTTKVKG